MASSAPASASIVKEGWADEVTGGGVFGGTRAPATAEEAAAEREFVRACDEELGPAARLWAYTSVLYDIRQALSVGLFNAGPLTAALWLLLSPLLVPALCSALRVRPQLERRRAAEARLRAAFAAASQRLAGGRRFLFGEAFGPADLALASLGFYAIGRSAQQVAPGAAWSPELESLPADMQTFALELRATPAGQHIERMLREELHS